MKPDWIIKSAEDGPDSRTIADLFNVDINIIRILRNRNIITREQIRDFLYPGLSQMHSPFLLDGMTDAVQRIRTAVDNREKLGIFSDSDLDGITSLKILHNLFSKIGLDIYYRYPKDNENYGLSKKIIDEFKDNNVGLVITADSGIRDVDEISYAKGLGMDFIITDHHEQDEYLPEAVIINPKKNSCGYPFKYLAGVGVAFKLCHAFLMSYIPGYNKNFILISSESNGYGYALIRNMIVIEQSRIDDLGACGQLLSDNDAIYIVHGVMPDELRTVINNEISIYTINEFFKNSIGNGYTRSASDFASLASYFDINLKYYENGMGALICIFSVIQLHASSKLYDFIKSCLEYVAIGTVADIMPLTDENRLFVKYGLEMMSKSNHNGISKLSESKTVDSKFISWEIAPFLNTPGRYGKTDLTVDFFLNHEFSDAQSLISEIKTLNDSRKKLIAGLYEKLTSGSIDTIRTYDTLIFAPVDNIPEGMTGLLASKLSEYYSRPAVVVSLPGQDGFCKGSGRCGGSFNFFKSTEIVSENFERIGGHAQAFGFSIELTRIYDTMDILAKEVDLSEYNNSQHRIDIDIEVRISSINRLFIENLCLIEPFGKGNEMPRFISKSVDILSMERFGKNQNHGRLNFTANGSIAAIGWNMADVLEDALKTGSRLDLVYTLENNSYNGRIYPRMILEDFSLS